MKNFKKNLIQAIQNQDFWLIEKENCKNNDAQQYSGSVMNSKCINFFLKNIEFYL